MFGGSAAPTPPVPALPDPLPSTPTYASGSSRPMGTANRPGTVGSTIMTSPLGDTSTANLGKKSLLGQ